MDLLTAVFLLLIATLSSRCQTTLQWSEIIANDPESDSLPQARYFQTATVYNDTIYVFGGYDGENVMNDLWKFTEEGWSDFLTGIPSVFQHSMVLQDERLYIFGGRDMLTNDFNDVWTIDLKNNQWSIVTVLSTPPQARYGHSAATVEDGFVIFGGNCISCTEPLRDLWYFNTSDSSWTLLSDADGPSGRYSTSSSVINGTLLIFGGTDGDDIYNDLWRFDLERLEWSLDASSGSKPSPRFAHSAVADGSQIILFGGLTTLDGECSDEAWVFSVDYNQWALIPAEGEAPTPRFGHSSVILGESADLAVFFGSSSDELLFNDLWLLQAADTPEESSIDLIHDKVLPGITGALMVIGFVGIALGMSFFYRVQGRF